jgi:hypothetical protein
MLCYKQLPHPTFTDTMFAGTTSKRGNKWAQVYATSFGWVQAHPMTQKGEAHETLSLLFHRDGVPPTMIFECSEEQAMGKFKRKLREADCHSQQTEPYSLWQQAAEGCIHELKRGTSRKMIKTGSPKTLWDHSIELEALVCSLTSNDIYMTHGEVPETKMAGSTADISHILSKFGWYDWVMFRDNIPTYPDDKLILGRYLGPATDVGSALTAKILKSNGQFVCRSTLRHLTNDKLQCRVHTEMRTAFDRGILDTLGPAAVTEDFPVEDTTSKYDHYDSDILDLNPDHSNIEVTPKYGDNYVGAEILLPRGGTMARGRVTNRKRDIDGNLKGIANANPILDTREYVVTFDDGDITELTANLIAESMYAQCDPDGNEYVLLDSIIDHRRLDTMTKLSDQTVVCNSGRTFKRRNTIGWQLCCQWKDGLTSWEQLSDLKESHPIEILPDNKPVPIGYQKIPCHMIFDINTEDFKRKA